MAALTVTTLVANSSVADVTQVAAGAAGDTFDNTGGKTFLRVVSTAGVQRTLTFDSVVNCDQGFDHDNAMTIEDSTTILFGPFSASRYNTSNLVTVTYSSEAGLTVGAVKFP